MRRLTETDYTRGVVIEGKRTGDTSIILAGVHGNEPAAKEAFDHIVPNLHIDQGIVIFAYGNPRAMNEGTRFSQGGANLNAMFLPDEELSEQQRKAYEYDRAQELKPILLQAGVLLDVHGTANPKSVPFVIAEEGGPLAIAKRLPYNIISWGYDEFQPGGTDYFMNVNGRDGICAETGPNHDVASIPRAITTIEDFLKIRGHKDGPAPAQRDTQRLIQVVGRHIATEPFKFARPFDEFEEVRKEDLLGVEGRREIRATRDGCVIFVSPSQSEERLVPKGYEAFLFGMNRGHGYSGI